MAESRAPIVTPGTPTTAWCRRCRQARTTVDLWVLTPGGMFKIGHRDACGCYR